MKKAPAPTKTQGAYGEQLSFLPPPPFCPAWPKRGTLADRALGLLMDGRMIDHPDFQESTQSWRLGAVIFTLRTLGWPVDTIEVPSPTEQTCLELEAAVSAAAAKLTCATDRRVTRARTAITGMVSRGVMGCNEGWIWLV